MGCSALSLRGIGYVPGVAQGHLQRGLPTQTDRIAVITPADIAALVQRPAGLVIVDGALFSHRLIRVLGWGVPTVIVAGGDLDALADGTPILIDGHDGTVTTRLDSARQRQIPRIPAVGQPIETADGVQVELRASVRSVAAAHKAIEMGAAAIGLVRTEFFAPDAGAVPDADFYLQVFSALCKAAGPLPVTFRLLDIAADKVPGWLHTTPAMLGSLGLQGVRLFGRSPVAAVVRAQLEAIAELFSTGYDVRILLPYLVRHEELRYWSGRVRERLPEAVAVGAMVETPAGAMDIDNWFDAADFVAVGCNDLMQCLFAADRDRPELGAYLDPYAPLLYRFFNDLAVRAGAHLGDIQLCGVLPHLQGVLPILLGLGFRNFSLDPGQIPYLAESVRRCDTAAMRAQAQAICGLRDSVEVLDILGLPQAGYRTFMCPDRGPV